MTTVNFAAPTVVRGRCKGCKTPWTLNTATHQVIYGASRPVAAIITDHENGDDEWTCPVMIHENLPCGAEESHDSDEDWGTDR